MLVKLSLMSEAEWTEGFDSGLFWHLFDTEAESDNWMSWHDDRRDEIELLGQSYPKGYWSVNDGPFDGKGFIVWMDRSIVSLQTVSMLYSYLLEHLLDFTMFITVHTLHSNPERGQYFGTMALRPGEFYIMDTVPLDWLPPEVVARGELELPA